MGLVAHLFGCKGESGYGSATTAAQLVQVYPDSVKGKVFLITGCNTGIGKETARALVAGGAHVVMACRDPKRMKEAATDILRLHPAAKLDQLQCDLTALDSVKACAEAFLAMDLPLHVLINNAGIMACPPTTTKDGIEMQFGTNVVGHFLLTTLLLPALKRTGTAAEPARVVNVSSMGHKFARHGIRFNDLSTNQYNSWVAYGQSKLGNVLFSRELARRMQEERAHVVSYSLHPGAIKTELARHNTLAQVIGVPLALFQKSIPQGAATQVYVSLAPVTELRNGDYYADCNIDVASGPGQDMAAAAKLWTVCEKLIENPRETSFA